MLTNSDKKFLMSCSLLLATTIALSNDKIVPGIILSLVFSWIVFSREH